jgi:hypothetical protein
LVVKAKVEVKVAKKYIVGSRWKHWKNLRRKREFMLLRSLDRLLSSAWLACSLARVPSFLFKLAGFSGGLTCSLAESPPLVSPLQLVCSAKEHED